MKLFGNKRHDGEERRRAFQPADFSQPWDDTSELEEMWALHKNAEPSGDVDSATEKKAEKDENLNDDYEPQLMTGTMKGILLLLVALLVLALVIYAVATNLNSSGAF